MPDPNATIFPATPAPAAFAPPDAAPAPAPELPDDATLFLAQASSERLIAKWLAHQETLAIETVDMPGVHRAVRSIARLRTARRTAQIVDLAEQDAMAEPENPNHRAARASSTHGGFAPRASAINDDNFDDEDDEDIEENSEFFSYRDGDGVKREFYYGPDIEKQAEYIMIMIGSREEDAPIRRCMREKYNLVIGTQYGWEQDVRNSRTAIFKLEDAVEHAWFVAKELQAELDNSKKDQTPEEPKIDALNSQKADRNNPRFATQVHPGRRPATRTAPRSSRRSRDPIAPGPIRTRNAGVKSAPLKNAELR